MSVTVKMGQKAYKSDYKSLSFEEFEEMRFEKEDECQHMHEIIKGCVVPYFDIEKTFEDELSYNKYRVQTLLAALDEIKRTYPKGKQMLFDASGFNISKDAWYLSTHVVIRGAGYYNSPKDLQPIVNAFRTPVFDKGVYGEGKSMRLPYCSKEGDPTRILRRVEIEDGKVFPIDESDCSQVLGEQYSDWFITNTTKEKTKLSKDEPEPEPEKDEFDERKEAYDSPEYAEVEKMIDMLSSKRAEQHNSRSYVIWALKHLSEETGMNLAPLAHKFARTSADYDESKTETAYNKRRPDGTACYTFGSIKYWAKLDSPDAFAAAQKKREPVAPTEETFYDEKNLLLQTKPDEAAVQTWMLGCLAYIEDSERWFVRFKGGWKVLPGNAKQPFPFSTMSSASSIQITGPKGKPTEKSFKDILMELKDTPVFNQCRYTSEAFVPYFKEPVRGIFNTFLGWMHAIGEANIAAEDADVKRVNDHLLDLCGKNEVVCEYLKNWLASIIQNPCQKMPVVVLYSKEEGVGKNILQDFLKDHVIGPKYVKPLQTTRSILGNFNTATAGRILSCINECKADGQSILDNEQFKSLVTEQDCDENGKFTNEREIKNWNKYMMFSNNKRCCIVGKGRRYLLVQCSDEHAGDAEYFKQLCDQILCTRTGEKYFNWLAQRDISRFTPSKIPDTDLKNDLKKDQMSSALQHVREICENKRDIVADLAAKPVVLGVKELYADYRQFCSDEGIQGKFVMKQSGYKEKLIEDLGIVYKQHCIGADRITGMLLDYDQLDLAFQKSLKIKGSIFERELPDEVAGQ